LSERRPQGHDGNSGWVVSVENVRDLFPQWPVIKSDAFAALEERTNISRSWYMGLSTRLISEGVITEQRGQKDGTRVPKQLDPDALFKIALLAQALKDIGLLYIASPKRTYAIQEFAETMRDEQNLC